MILSGDRSGDDAMLQASVRMLGDTYFIEIPQEGVERLSLEHGQDVILDITPLASRSIRLAEIDKIVDELIETHREALEYPADH
jgi:antitoxin component of MazEF toxin-antitoxin module